MNFSQKRIIAIISIMFLIQTNLSDAALQQLTSAPTDYEKVAKINDYVEYSFTTSSYTQTGEPLPLNPAKHGSLRWTVTAVNGTNISLTITVHVGDFYSDQKNIIVSNRIAYTEDFQQLGFIPFWIPLEQIDSDPIMNISLDGQVNNPLLGRTVPSNYNLNFLGGVRSLIWFTNPNNYYAPHVVGGNTIDGYNWYFSEYNGILVEINQALIPIIWWTLQFTYQFTGTLIVSSTNLDFGPIDIPLSILHLLLPFLIPLVIISIILIFFVSMYIIRRIRKRH